MLMSIYRISMIPVGFMFIHCKQGSQDDVIRHVLDIPGIIYAYKLDKSYDIVVKVESDSVEEFTTAISKIRLIANMLNTDTMIGFKKS